MIIDKNSKMNSIETDVGSEHALFPESYEVVYKTLKNLKDKGDFDHMMSAFLKHVKGDTWDKFRTFIQKLETNVDYEHALFPELSYEVVYKTLKNVKNERERDHMMSSILKHAEGDKWDKFRTFIQKDKDFQYVKQVIARNSPMKNCGWLNENWFMFIVKGHLNLDLEFLEDEFYNILLKLDHSSTPSILTYETVFETMKNVKDIRQRNKMIAAIVRGAEGEVWNKYRKFEADELFHIKHVNKVMTDLSKGIMYYAHDWSKDDWYLFVTIGHFNLEKEEAVKGIVDKLIKDHKNTENHHPDNEDYEFERINKENIREVAVKRLSRNLQFNGGKFNEGQLEKHIPPFRCPNCRCPLCREKCIFIASCMKYYKKCIQDMKPITKKIWDELKREKSDNLKEQLFY